MRTICDPLHHILVLVLSGCLQALFWNPWASILNCVLQYFEMTHLRGVAAEVNIYLITVLITQFVRVKSSKEGHVRLECWRWWMQSEEDVK